MKISSIARINFSLILLCVTAVLFASAVGIMPDERVTKAKSRANVCEALATSATILLAKEDPSGVEIQLRLYADRHDELISAGLRQTAGTLVAEAGGHETAWRQDDLDDGAYIVPIQTNGEDWGVLEIQFEPLYSGLSMFFSPVALKLIAVLVPLVGFTCWVHLSRILRYLDPSRAVPPRVRQTLDSFAEGVVVLDQEDRVVLANDAFSDYTEMTSTELIGKPLGSLPWELGEGSSTYPWLKTRETKEVVLGATISLPKPRRARDNDGDLRRYIFSVNATPVIDDNDAYQGTMVALADVTPLEQQRAELAVTLEELNKSKNEITAQNEELRFLATRDPLTNCINRRTFFEQFAIHWDNTKNPGIPLCAMMVDIDFFKSINDNYGHSMGDEVLRQTGALLNELSREDDVVCRYGGEEFSILMPGLTVEEAEAAAEAIRIGMSQLEFPEFTITASLGVSSADLGAPDPQGMLDQADKCLYVAKRNGRNQVVRFDTVPEDLVVDDSKISRVKPEDEEESGPTIPFPAVTALLSALSYRDNYTGLHSTRVSSYAALLAQRVLSPRDVYVVEMAALLHDIGKVGVPDAILLKPGPLTKDEWRVMERHDRIGVEIIKKSFRHAKLTEIVEHHHARFDGIDKSCELTGTDIPIGARILTIADSFDAMTSDRPYRKGKTIAEALVELRRCAGTQFDPELTECFCEIIESGAASAQGLTDTGLPNEVLLGIGEQVERIVDAADQGDHSTFVALTERLRLTAEQSQVSSIASAAERAIESTGEDAQLEQLVEQSFELLAACRSMRTNMASTCAEVDDSEPCSITGAEQSESLV